jgi:serine/threonine-protein kinase
MLELQPYYIDHLVAAGGMGEVYAARHPALDRKVALKVLHAHVAAQPEALARFRREALVLARLEHPHAVRLYDFIESGPRPFLVMELVEGQSLDAALRDWGPLPFEDVAQVAQQVLEVLEVAHAQGIVHRDLKPANVMLDATHAGVFVRVVDFGIALLQVGPTAGARLTVDGQVPGTAAYMSPEQVNGEALDARSDLYSLACVLFALLTGRPPFESAQAVNVLTAHLFREPPMLEEVAKVKVPPAWQSVLRRSLSKPREARFSSAREMRVAFEEALREGSRGERERAPELDLPHEFIAAQADDPPVAVQMGGASSADQQLLAEALAGIGATVTTELLTAKVVVLGGADGEAALARAEQVRSSNAGAQVLLCGDEQDFSLMTRALQRGVFDFIPMPLERGDVGRRVVRALKAGRRP